MTTSEHDVGLDVHRDSVAVAHEGRGGEVRIHGKISSDLRAVCKIGRDGPSLAWLV